MRSGGKYKASFTIGSIKCTATVTSYMRNGDVVQLFCGVPLPAARSATGDPKPARANLHIPRSQLEKREGDWAIKTGEVYCANPFGGAMVRVMISEK